ncbi:MAG: bifunctional pyr operon transcriptional regulator/uracil phosphoribosyltransferase PyrR [Candidatus Omnitrophica bacterium]|nr:bifunctional pyr operon transcriptional regulator/uracil phosphoribosyltransferase PyrR [Candidatus Omnitrophota bacterium]
MESQDSVRKILDAQGVDRAITRMTHEILEKNKGTEHLVLIGIERGGVILAERLRHKIQEIEGVSVPKGTVDITLYRDDLGEGQSQPVMRGTHLEFDITGKKVVLVDDVLFTGRSVRSALDALIDFGRPKWAELAVLVDRGHREIPIRADYVGKNIPTSLDEEVAVCFKETEGVDEVCVVRKAK